MAGQEKMEFIPPKNYSSPPGYLIMARPGAGRMEII
jgi:hypothetical protein